MKKPEKKAMLEGVEILTHEKEIKKFQDGYNQGWDDREAWLKEVASGEKIYNILDMVIYRQFQFKNKLMNDDDIRNLAKEIHKLIGK